MKCENCGKNEANFVYRSSINGRTEEYHLCQACAEKLGYTQRFFEQRPSIMDSFFGNNGFFGSMPSLMGRILDSPFDDFFEDMPAIGAAPVQEIREEKRDDLMSGEEQSRFSYTGLYPFLFLPIPADQWKDLSSQSTSATYLRIYQDLCF